MVVEITIHADGGDMLTIKVDRRGSPDAADYWDGNWLLCTLSVKAGGFRGGFDASLHTHDLSAFRDAIHRSIRDPRVSFDFSSIEGQLSIEAHADGLGHFDATCIARDEAGTGNELRFSLQFDQTRLPALAEQLDAILNAYPILGKRP